METLIINDIGDAVRAMYEVKPFPPVSRRGYYVANGHAAYVLDRAFGGDRRKAKGKRIADFGCGTGVMMTDIASHIGPGPEYTLVDFTKASLQKAEDHIRNNKGKEGRGYLGRIKILEANLMKLAHIMEGEMIEMQLNDHDLCSQLDSFEISDMKRDLKLITEESGKVPGKRVLLTKDEKGFDYMQSWGVIHHTANPQHVFEELCALLNFSGYIRIGVYGEVGNAERRDQIGRMHAATEGMNIQEKIKWAREFMSRPDDYNPDLCKPRLDAKERHIEDSEIVDEFFHVHEHHLTLREVVAWFRAEGLEIIELTDFDNKPISFDIAEHTNNPALIEAFDRMGHYDRKIGKGELSLAQADLLDRQARPYWIALLGKNRKLGSPDKGREWAIRNNFKLSYQKD